MSIADFDINYPIQPIDIDRIVSSHQSVQATQSVKILIFDLTAALVFVKVEADMLNSHRERFSADIVPLAHRACFLCFRESNSAFFRVAVNVVSFSIND